MGQVIQFIRKAELERARLIREARAIYDPQLVTARTHLQKFRSGMFKCKHNPQAALIRIATPGLKGRFSANRF
jgi:hypothetical protein